jgi:hypothetical protein
LAATADIMLELAGPILESLHNANREGIAPWDAD